MSIQIKVARYEKFKRAKKNEQEKYKKNKNTPKETHSKQNKAKERKRKKNQLHFSKWFFACSLPVSSSNSLEHKPFSYWNYVIC